MKKRIAIVFFGLLGLNVMAQQPLIELWPQAVPGSAKEKAAPVKEFSNKDSVLRYTEVTNPTLEVFEPKESHNRQGVIVCPGGGYGILAYNLEGTEIAQWLNKQGITAFVLAYRVPQQADAALQDLQRAIRTVRAKYKMQQVGVIGFSAGGSLSARAATRFNESLYPKVDAVDELSARPDFALLIYPAYLDQGSHRTLTPELTLSAETPPIFLFATADDVHSNSALVMATALHSQKLSVELHLLPVGGHGYGLRSGAGLQWPLSAYEWMSRRFASQH